MIRVDVTIDDPATLLGTDAFGAGALLRLERSATEAGVYAEVDTATLVDDTHLYTFWDPSGADSSWYRWRVSNVGNTQQTGYSDPFQGDDVSDAALANRYVSLDEVVAGYNQDLDSRHKARLDDAIRDATQEIIDLLGFDFFRHPASGTAVSLVDVDGGSRLCVHDGIVPDSLTLVEVRSTVHADWESLASTDWELEPPDKLGHPSFHLRLTGVATWPRWPCGPSLARFTGAKGWPAVPRSVRRATRDRARQLVAWDPTRPGGPVGPEELGVLPGPNRMPDTMYRLRHDYSAWELGLAQCEL